MLRGYSSIRLRLTGFFQGGYYALSGLWALVSISSFQMVTGPKTDIWLVKTVALLLLVSGLVLLFSAARNLFPLETILLAVGNALALTIIEIIYTAAGRISFIYLLDAFLELVLIGIWISTVLQLKKR